MESASVPFFGPAAVEAVNSVKVEPVVEFGEGGKAQIHDFRHEFSAPVTGITLSTRVGRLRESHSDIGFQLHSIPKSRRKVRETQGEKVSALVLFEQTVDRSAVASLCTIQLHERAAKGLGVET